MASSVYYKNYLELDTLLNAQHPESEKAGKPAHDEMLFIIVHQTYELWFKQILHELNSIRHLFSQQAINDNAPDMQVAVHRLKRVAAILQVLVHQIDVLETMTPLDFLDFRDLLRPASGFQSYQFKIIEAVLGLKFEQRFEQNYYVSHLRPEELEQVRQAERQPSLLHLVQLWLERMPFLYQPEWWNDYHPVAPGNEAGNFWTDYRWLYQQSLSAEEQNNLEFFDEVLLRGSSAPGRLTPAASRSALFIMLYRDFPMLQLPFQLINTLLDLDELMALWRYRHLNMVQRMIGSRIGTGGSSGKHYLKGALERHYIFSAFAELTTFLIERSRLPQLPLQLQQALGYSFERRAP
ncbi:MAG: tryptophan 2,3-dioxygenase family protein [Chitinophagales bacterium]|nr:tryptophan 2,3-dioxygenase [Chitinophagales bacterium]MDW8394142.1 tryptophan 2,3-dioxygenase family protein [Chitinophagales bacterium]